MDEIVDFFWKKKKVHFFFLFIAFFMGEKKQKIDVHLHIYEGTIFIVSIKNMVHIMDGRTIYAIYGSWMGPDSRSH